jgi:DNA-binding NarL/FixJ family response regulator
MKTGNDAGDPDPFADLTAQELRVMDLLVQPCNIREIAEKLRVSTATVMRCMTNIYDKLGVCNRLDLVQLVRRHRGPAPPG